MFILDIPKRYIGEPVIVSWQHSVAHATVTKLNPGSIRVVIDSEGPWKGLELNMSASRSGEKVYALDDPGAQKWLTKNPVPKERATAAEVASKKRPRDLPGDLTKTGKIPKNRTALIQELFSRVKKAELYSYSEMTGTSIGPVSEDLIPKVIEAALKDLRTIRHSYLFNNGGGKFTVHVHSNLFYTFHI